MKQQRKFITIAALALTLGLGLGVAHAQNFISLTGSIYKVTNSSGSTIKGWCRGDHHHRHFERFDKTIHVRRRPRGGGGRRRGDGIYHFSCVRYGANPSDHSDRRDERRRVELGYLLCLRRPLIRKQVEKGATR